MTNVRKNGIFKGFRARVFWTLTTLLLALSVFLTVIVIYQQGKLLKEDIVARGLSISGNLAHGSKLGIFTESSEFLEPVMRSVGLEKDFVYAVIYNLKWEVIAVHSSEKGVIPDIPGELKERLYEKPLSFYQKTVYHDNELYEFWNPVLIAKEFKGEDIIVDMGLLGSEQSLPAVSHGQDELKELKRQIGVVRVALSLSGIKSRLQKIIRNSIFITLLFLSAALLHDIGKIGIPDHILLKITRLTDDEYRIMKGHSEIGVKILEGIADFKEEGILVRHHHEYYNGNGYPNGLSGEEIPLGSRIIAVADAYEAMTNTMRPYRKAIQPVGAVEELTRMSNIQFDPRVVDTFVTVLAGKGIISSLSGRVSPDNAETR